MQYPPVIVHVDQKESDKDYDLISMTALALHMSKGEAALLRFYAACKTGFRPALQYIANETGLTRKQVQNNRHALIQHGIVWIEDRCLYVNWERIRLFSTLDPKMTGRHHKIAPAAKKLPYNIYAFNFLCFPTDELIEWLNGLSSKEYEYARRSYRRYVKESESVDHEQQLPQTVIDMYHGSKPREEYIEYGIDEDTPCPEWARCELPF